MDKSTFEAVDPLINEIAELTDKVLASDELARLREALTRLGATLDEQYAVNLSVVVDISDRDKQRYLPLLNTGLSTSEGDEPYRTYGDSSPQRYVVDGEMQVVPHDRCPQCWNAWEFKWQNHSCPHCDATLGENCMILLDTDTCPNCEKSTVSMAKPICDRCGFRINPAFVVWG